MRFFVLVVILAALQGGCAVVYRPSARIQWVALTDQTNEGSRVVFAVELKNNTDTPLPMTEASYTIVVDGGGSFGFTDSLVATMPPHGGREILLAGALANSGKDLSGQPYRVFGRVAFEPPGEIRKILTESGVPLPTVAFAASGRLQKKTQ